AQYLLDERPAASELFAKAVEIGDEVAGLVDHVDQIGAYDPLGGIRDRHIELLEQMILQGNVACDIGLKVGRVVAVAPTGALTQACPRAGRAIRFDTRRCAVRIDVFSLRIESGRSIAARL